MESFKNGHVISDKYVCSQKSQEGVKVVVFLTHIPQCHQFLSADSIKIYNLDIVKRSIPNMQPAPSGSKKRVRFEAPKPYARPASPPESTDSRSTTASLREEYRKLTVVADKELEAEKELTTNERLVLQKSRDSIITSLRTITREFGLGGSHKSVSWLKDIY